MPSRFWVWVRKIWAFYWPVLVAFVAVKIGQMILYPDPYLMSDSGEYLNSARTLQTNAYAINSFSLFAGIHLPFKI